MPLGSIFYAKIYIFCEKTYNCQNFGRKIILLTIEEYFFSKFKITRWNSAINKEGFLAFSLCSKSEAVTQRNFVKKSFLENLQNSQENSQSLFFNKKAISKVIRKTIVPSFMFHFNSFEVCCPLCKESKNIQFSPLNQWNKK